MRDAAGSRNRRSAFLSRRIARLAVIAATGLVSVATAAGPDISCAKSITVKQTIASVPEGWQVGYDPTPNALSAITFYEGPPQQGASLVYDREWRSGKERHATWRFQQDPTRGIWLECRYAGTSATLSTRLPQTVSECTITYKADIYVAGMPAVDGLRCRQRR